MNRPLHPTTARFLMQLTAAVTETLSTWGCNHSPDTLVGLCPRRFPVSRDGKTLLTVDEVLWQRGRARYGVRP